MSEIITKEHIPEYEAFLQAHPKGHFAQSVLWAKQKPMWKWEAIVSRDANGTIKGSLAVLIRKIVPGLPFTMMYGCRGPVTDLDDKQTHGATCIDGAQETGKAVSLLRHQDRSRCAFLRDGLYENAGGSGLPAYRRRRNLRARFSPSMSSG